MGRKFFTLSYDDGTVFDRRLVKLLNTYGLKATFNLNSGLFGMRHEIHWDRYTVDHSEIEAEEVESLYRGHEVAAHTLTHPNLLEVSPEEAVRQVEEDRKALSALCGYAVRGMAYPGGLGTNDALVAILRDRTQVEYARTICSHRKFLLPDNWLVWHPTEYHCAEDLTELGDAFLKAESEADLLFYVWGHSYELEAFRAWERAEAFFEKMAGHDDIIYATNIEVKDRITGAVK